MSTSTGAFGLAAHNRKKSSRKVLPQHLLGSVAVAGVVLGCAWTVYTNVFGASVYPSMNRRRRCARRQAVERCCGPPGTAGLQRGVRGAARAGAEDFCAETVPPSIMFNERFAASAAQGVAPGRLKSRLKQRNCGGRAAG